MLQEEATAHAPAAPIVPSGAVEHGVPAQEHTAEGHERPEIPNIVTLLRASSVRDTPVVKFLHHWETPLFSLLVVAVLGVVVAKTMSRRTLIPGKMQNLIEMLIEGLNNFFCDILGDKYGKKFALYVTSLFLFILANNLMGLIPFCKAPTSVYNTTLALAILTFCYVQFIAIRENGLWGYLYHLLGSPKDVVGWCLVPLLFPLHLIGELAKPVSLSLRLFGNIMGEDILLAVFVILGISLVSLTGAPQWVPGLPLQFPFFFLALLTSTIQALVFALLSCIYILLVLPHDEHH